MAGMVKAHLFPPFGTQVARAQFVVIPDTVKVAFGKGVQGGFGLRDTSAGVLKLRPIVFRKRKTIGWKREIERRRIEVHNTH
jgi:hypothetical protein